MARKKQTRVVRLEEVPIVSNDEFHQASHEETELSDFLDSLGPEVSEIHLYQILPSGKKVFRNSGHPSLFTEQAVQLQFGAGDYQARGKLNGKWVGAKNFAVAAPPGTVSNDGAGPSAELERVKADLEAQRTRIEQQQLKMEADRREQDARMEADRREREQRNHELQLEMFRSFANRDNSMNIADVINSFKSLKELGGNENGSSTSSVLASVREGLQIVKDLRAETTSEPNSGADDPPWLAVVKEIVAGVKDVAASPIAPFILSKVMGTANGAPTPAASNAIAIPAPAAMAPAAAAGQAAWVPPVGAGVVVPPAPSAPVPSADMVPTQPAAQPAETPQASAPQAAPSPSMSPEEQLVALKRQGIQVMLPYALRDADPRFCAGLAFDAIDSGNIDVLRIVQDLISTKNFGAWFEDIRKVEPIIFDHRDWFSELYEALREQIAAREEALRAGFGEQPVNSDKQK